MFFKPVIGLKTVNFNERLLNVINCIILYVNVSVIENNKYYLIRMISINVSQITNNNFLNVNSVKIFNRIILIS
jgi:hypothetical protein